MHGVRYLLSFWVVAGIVAGAIVAQDGVLTCGFEGVAAGELRLLDTPVGRWSAARGHAVIDAAHHRGGRQCLHIVGGKARTVVLATSAVRDVGEVDELRFWAERWTRRSPFEFRVEQRMRDQRGWREIYRGDESVVIGTFKTQVRVPLAGMPAELRFVCSSPAGVLIDDVSLGRAVPMQLVRTTVEQPVVPCLVGNPVNAVARLILTTTGRLERVVVREVEVDLAGTTDLADLAAVELLTTAGEPFGRPQLNPSRERLVFRGEHALVEGENELVISVTLKPGADIDHFVDAGCPRIVVADGRKLVPTITHPRGSQRCGLALRRAGDGGSQGYRIPAITTTREGTLIAVYDVRWRGMSDLPGDIDVGMSRSRDGGRTWEPMRVILDQGKDPEFRFDGVGDPAILHDHVRGVTWVAATWSHGDRSWRGSGPGVDPVDTGQLLLVSSTDDGVTWSEPINITRQVKRPEWCFLLQGPGRGICLQDGSLVFAAQYQDTPENGRTPHSTILYSRDGGKSWRLGNGAKPNTTEAQVEELGKGTLMLNMRDNRGGARSVFMTTDFGDTWVEHPTSRRALVEPVCNAALLRVGVSDLLFVNPAVRDRPRRRMTIKRSTDLGATWPAANQLLIDAGASAGYPSITRIGREHVALFYEGSNAMLAFLRIPLADIPR